MKQKNTQIAGDINKYLLSTYSVPGARDTAVNKTKLLIWKDIGGDRLYSEECYKENSGAVRGVKGVRAG